MWGRLRSVSGWLQSRVAAWVWIGALLFAVVIGARELGWLVPWELGALDNFVRLRPPRTLPSPEVMMVWIGEEEILELGHPLPDSVLASAVATLEGLGPSAIGIDVYRDRATGDGWADLRTQFLANSNLVIVEKLADSTHPGVQPPSFLSDRSQVGFSDVTLDGDGVVRRGLLILWDEDGKAFLSFALQLALRHLRVEGITLEADPDQPDFVRLGPTTLLPLTASFGGYKHADDAGYQFLLDYRRTRDSFPSVTLSQLLAGDVDPADFRDKVVLLGTVSPSVKDYFQTPSSAVFGGDAQMFGVELHAHAVDQLLRYARGEDAPIGSPAEPAEALWILAWCLIGAGVGSLIRSPVSLTLAGVAGLCLLFGSGFVGLLFSRWVPVVPTAIGGLGSMALAVAWVTKRERADKAQVMQLFGRFVSPRVFDQIWRDRGIFMEGRRPRPQRITVTVLLSDLTGYTTASEKSEPADVMAWIGTYMGRMADLVDEHDGMVNDFLGDGLMANFGVPTPRMREEQIERDARNAVECALAMGEGLERLNEEWRRSGKPTARLRIGILSGPGVVGALGSEAHLKYTTVGNTVNTASRLESFDKVGFEMEPEQSTCRILIGESTLRRLGGRFRTECLGAHRLRGKDEPITIYRVLGRADENRSGDAVREGRAT